MAFCSKCGAQINDNAQFCPKCGQPNNAVQQQQVNQFQQQYEEQPQEEEMKLWQKILFFLFGPAGLIAGVVYLIRKKSAMAKSAFLWGGIGTVLCIALTNMSGSSKSNIEQTTKEIMVDRFKKDGINCVVKKINLVHKSGNEYEGIAECKVDGEDVQYSLKVLSDGETVQAEWMLSNLGGGGADDETVDDEEYSTSSSAAKDVAEAGYNAGYETGFDFADMDSFEPDAKTSFSMYYGAPSTPEEKRMYNIYKENYERGFREGKRVGRE